MTESADSFPPRSNKADYIIICLSIVLIVATLFLAFLSVGEHLTNAPPEEATIESQTYCYGVYSQNETLVRIRMDIRAGCNTTQTKAQSIGEAK